MIRTLARRLGWRLQGYPAAIHTRHLHLDEVPGWARIYRLGVRLYRWGDDSFVGGWCSAGDCPCNDPGPPCEEYMGPVPDEDGGVVDLRCPRCGWSEGTHGR
jgi:hypothetical protein